MLYLASRENNKLHGANRFTYNKSTQIVAQCDVRSISFPFNSFQIRRILVKEQVQRAHKLCVPLEEAFKLSGHDPGLLNNELVKNWGGDVHIPYEGM